MRNSKISGIGVIVALALLFGFEVRGQESRDSLKFEAKDTLLAPALINYAPFNPSFERFLQLMAPDRVLSKEELALKANIYAREELNKSMAWTMEHTILHPMVTERANIDISQRHTAIGYLAPFSIPFGFVPIMNSSNPFAIARIPGWAPEPNRYSPDVFPQCVELEYDAASGKFRQVAVSWEDYNNKIKVGGGGKFGNNPIPAAAVTPVERSMQSLH